jgi:hypothetical protein
MSFFYLFRPPNCPIEPESSHALFIFFIVAATEGRLEMLSQRPKKKFFLFTLFPGVSYPQATSPVIFLFFLCNFKFLGL